MDNSNIAGTAGRITGHVVVALRWFWAQLDWELIGDLVFRGVVTFAVIVYLLGLGLGTLVHRASAWLGTIWSASLVAPQPSGDSGQLALPPAPAPLALLAPARLVVAEPEPAPVAPAPDHFEHLPNMVTPLEQARQLVATGTSVRQAARRCGISRTTLQRRLMAA